jgi:hypothetical protein
VDPSFGRIADVIRRHPSLRASSVIPRSVKRRSVALIGNRPLDEVFEKSMTPGPGELQKHVFDQAVDGFPAKIQPEVAAPFFFSNFALHLSRRHERVKKMRSPDGNALNRLNSTSSTCLARMTHAVALLHGSCRVSQIFVTNKATRNTTHGA